jgi:light-regulated signal transduction histidine kinase (bacteriophytochrome)
MAAEPQQSKIGDDLPTIIVDPSNGIILSVSPAVEMLLGIKTGSLAGKHISSVITQKDPIEEVTRFISDAGHDLVAPLNHASSLAGLFLRKYRGQFDADASEMAKHMRTVAERMSVIVRGVSKYVQLSTTVCDFKRVDMNDVFAAALLPFTSQIKDGGTTLTSEPLGSVMGDASLLITLLSELLDNALKFRNPAHSPVIRVFTREVVGPSAVFSVADNGLGIAAEHRDGLFRAFRRLHGHDYPGLGLGLATVRRIVELHGRSVWIESDTAEGTTISFSLPLGSK